MLYAILGIIVVVALFLLFRDDHDDSYNKSEKGQRKAQQPQPKQEQPQYHEKSGPSLKEQFRGQIKEQVHLLGEMADMTKEAVITALKEAAQQEWNEPGTQPDEQFPDDIEGIDLSFLDNIEYNEALEENTDTFDINDLEYHCTDKDCGMIVGIVRPEPSNLHDGRAQAVYRNDGKLLGYIPEVQLDWYEAFNEQNVPCPFVGKIEYSPGAARLVAEIKVIMPTSREYVEAEIACE